MLPGHPLEEQDQMVDMLPTLKERLQKRTDPNILYSIINDLAKVPCYRYLFDNGLKWEYTGGVLFNTLKYPDPSITALINDLAKVPCYDISAHGNVNQKRGIYRLNCNLLSFNALSYPDPIILYNIVNDLAKAFW